MCQLTDAARWVLGIHPYVWTPKPPAPTGVRALDVNGAGFSRTPGGLTADERRMLEALERDHRIIRQTISDVARRCARGPR